MIIYAPTSGAAVPRRTVAASDDCNKCHDVLEFHGGNRKNAQTCAFCHHPKLAAGNSAESWNNSTMIHRFHGEEVRYLGTLQNCGQCHIGSSQLPPVKNGLAPDQPDAAGHQRLPLLPNETLSWQHAAANISTFGESCTVCHGASKDLDVSKAPAQYRVTPFTTRGAPPPGRAFCLRPRPSFVPERAGVVRPKQAACPDFTEQSPPFVRHR